MQVVILCGGKGTRMGPDAEKIPKPLFTIGDKPILWHLMKLYATQGFNDFVLCAGHQAEKIKEFTEHCTSEGWKITVVDTGLETLKSERILKVAPHIKGDHFFVSYGDDLIDADFKKILAFHKEHGRLCTVTAVKMVSPFGVIDFDTQGKILDFKEKPVLDIWMNGGFMVFKKEMLPYLHGKELEDTILPELAKKGEVYAYRHSGKWKSMNTVKDNQEMNDLWKNNKAFWKVW